MLGIIANRSGDHPLTLKNEMGREERETEKVRERN